MQHVVPTLATPVVEEFQHEGWTFKCLLAPMLNSKQLQEVSALPDSPPMLPECLFGENFLSVENPKLKFKWRFSAADALQGCNLKKTAACLVHPSLFAPTVPQVQFAEHWQKQTNTSAAKAQHLNPTYDWTFTTGYWGTLTNTESGAPIDTSNCKSDLKLPFERLKSQEDPILWYKKIDFWIDDLSDCGVSLSSCRIRVNQGYWYLLLSFDIRVDFVVIRKIETRLFHDFKTDYAIRQFTWKEADYQTLQKRGGDQKKMDEMFESSDIKLELLDKIYPQKETNPTLEFIKQS